MCTSRWWWTGLLSNRVFTTRAASCSFAAHGLARCSGLIRGGGPPRRIGTGAFSAEIVVVVNAEGRMESARIHVHAIAGRTGLDLQRAREGRSSKGKCNVQRAVDEGRV